MSNNKNYWGYRIDKNRIPFFIAELDEGRLRQGWGYDSQQDLRNLTIDGGARRNLPIFNNVKKGDILLVPRLPDWGKVAVIEATEDFNKGYRFEMYNSDGKYGDFNDYGHIFPAKFIKSFGRYNKNVTGNIRSTLKNIGRFWNVNHCANDIETIINIDEKELETLINNEDRFKNSIETVFNECFDENKFSDNLFEKLNNHFNASEWEILLVKGLEKLFPNCAIEKVGGRDEKKHGTDILIKIPSITKDYQYGIAIQVKDYNNYVGKEVIDQINKAEFWNKENIRLIDKFVIITNAKKENNKHLVDDRGVKIIFTDELKSLLLKMGKSHIGIRKDE